MRNKLTISLKDQLGNDFNAPCDIGVAIYSKCETDYDHEDWGEFYEKHADVYKMTEPVVITIPKGSSCTEIYYRPTYTGEHQIYASTERAPNDSLNSISASCIIEVEPAGSTILDVWAVDGLTELTAGEYGLIEISILDQYWFYQPQASDVTVKLFAEDEKGNSVGAFYKADDQGNVIPGESIDSVTIKKDDSYALVYYMSEVGKYNERWDDGYLVWLGAQVEVGPELETWMDWIEIFPAAAEKLVITPVKHVEDGKNVAGLAGDMIKFRAKLLDRYGNLAKPQPGELTVQLKSSSGTGVFYDSDYYQVTQLTFSEDYGHWYGKKENQVTFYYKDTVPQDNVSIWAEASGLEPVKAEIKILPAPKKVNIAVEPDKWLVNQRGKVTIALEDVDGQPYTVPEEIEEGIDVYVATSASEGSFYDALVGGKELRFVNGRGKSKGDEYRGVIVNIPAGKDAIDIYYAPQVGENRLIAGVRDVPGVEPGEVFINASPAAGVIAVISTEFDPENPQIKLSFVAGKASEVYVAMVDQNYNLIKQDKDITVYIDAYNKIDGELSETGHFYEAVDENGNPRGEPIHQVTIKKGDVVAKVYYLDTRATGSDYQLVLGTQFTPAYYHIYDATVKPASAQKLEIKIFGHPYYETHQATELGAKLYIANNDYNWTIKGHEETITNLASSGSYRMEVSIVDANGNPVKQSSDLTVKLSSKEKDVFCDFYEVIDVETGLLKALSQLTFKRGESTKTINVEVSVPEGSDNKTATIIADAPGLYRAEYPVTIWMGDRLQIHFPLILEWNEEKQEYEEKGDNNVVPEGLKPFVVLLTDAQGNPHIATQDIKVQLSGATFYENQWDGNAIEEITIPFGYHGVQVYVEGLENEGTMTISAGTTAEGIENAEAVVVKVENQSYLLNFLERGWNTLSTPVKLERTALEDIIEEEDKIKLVYAYDAVNREWKQVARDENSGKWFLEGSSEPYKLEPLEAIYVKMNGGSFVNICVSREATSPPTKSLVAGWNLVGPSITDREIKVNEVLKCVEGKYSQVVSPNIGMQPGWVYVPGAKQIKYMSMGCGYWVYMKEAGELAGSATTPIKDWYDFHTLGDRP